MDRQPPPTRMGAIVEFFIRARAFLERPICKVGIGLCLVVTAIAEITHAIIEDAHKIGAHHGLLVFGLAQVGSYMGTLFEGVKKSYLAMQEQRRRTAEAANNTPGAEPLAIVTPVPVAPTGIQEVAAPTPRVPAPITPPVAIQAASIVLALPGLLTDGLGPYGTVLVPRFLAVPGVERVTAGGDAVAIHLAPGVAPGRGLLKALAAALRETRSGAVSRSRVPNGSPSGSTRRAS